MTEQDFTQELMRSMEQNLFRKFLGLVIEERSPEYSRGSIPVADRLKNPLGTIHGGALYSLADTIAGACANVDGPAVTVSGNMNYINPAMKTDRIICEARCVRKGAHLGVYDVVMKDEDELTICTATFTFFQLPEKKAEVKD